MKLTTRDLILIPMFSALIAVGAFIKVPLPLVPFTLQFLFTAFAGILLGAHKSLISVLIYIAIGLIGIPVFANGGGFNYIFHPTFGYLIGFSLCAFVIGFILSRFNKITFPRLIIAIVSGLFCLYLLGIPYMYMIVNFHLGKEMSVGVALATGFFPFIVSDLLQSIFIAYVASKVIPILQKSGAFTTKYA